MIDHHLTDPAIIDGNPTDVLLILALMVAGAVVITGLRVVGVLRDPLDAGRWTP